MKALMRSIGAVHAALYRATGGRLLASFRGAPMLLLTTTGRRSGKRRTTPLMYGRSGDDLVLVASVGGAPRHPGWYHNLHAGGGEVQVGGERWSVRARDAEGEERERLWEQMVGLYPTYAEYQKKTERRIPVVLLERGSS